MLSSLAILLFMSAHPKPHHQFVLALIAIGFMLTAVVEIVVLKGDISRMNTVFKFYFQVWVLGPSPPPRFCPCWPAGSRRIAAQQVQLRLKLRRALPGHLRCRPGCTTSRQAGGSWGNRWWWPLASFSLPVSFILSRLFRHVLVTASITATL